MLPDSASSVAQRDRGKKHQGDYIAPTYRIRNNGNCNEQGMKNRNTVTTCTGSCSWHFQWTQSHDKFCFGSINSISTNTHSSSSAQKSIVIDLTLYLVYDLLNLSCTCHNSSLIIFSASVPSSFVSLVS
jgi:hypothetical protein